MTERLGAYLEVDEFLEAKSAYLGDWRADHLHNTFPAWVADAIERHARRTPQERAALAAQRPLGGQRLTRTFHLPDGTRSAVTAARREDERVDRFVPEIGWIAEAMIAASRDARARHGDLPPAPKRLPNRLS